MKYKIHNCDLCGQDDAIEVPHCREYTLGKKPVHICKNCGLVYVRKRRSTQEIANEWSEKLFKGHYTAFMPASKARLLYVADFINQNIGLGGKKLCDIGAGEGYFLRVAQDQYAAKAFGIEPSHENCKRLWNQGSDCFNGTIEEYDGSIKNYLNRSAYTDEEEKVYEADIVTILWTMENTPNCNGMLLAARKILKKEGYIVIATGSRILVPFKKPLDLYFSKTPVDTNNYKCSANTQQALLAKNGFKTVYVNRYIDSDTLCIIAQKTDKKVKWKGDDYKKVRDFFKRWHKEDQFYRGKK